jgi:KDO2-lipid IV(A) lauroyltransferase
MLIRDIRSKYNTELVNTSKTIPYIARNQKQGILSIYGLPSDQSNRFSLEFLLGIEVPVHTGS